MASAVVRAEDFSNWIVWIMRVAPKRILNSAGILPQVRGARFRIIAGALKGSRIPGFYRLTPRERVRTALEHGLLNESDFKDLANGRQTLDAERADRMIENVIGVLGLPVGLGLNFLINGREYVAPMAVEEPSVVAALSSAAKLVRESGGFRAEADEPVLIGQIQLLNVPEPARAAADLLSRREEIIRLANSIHPRMVARGGGVVDVEVHRRAMPGGDGELLVLHLLVDTRDAMGANLVNSMCEGVSALVESMSGGQVFMRILSNLSDRALARAEVEIPVELLAGKEQSGNDVGDGIALAAELAATDPYRAATHNKGIMNGVDAVALATGNDWRALEAGAHAWAARHGQYTALSKWWRNERGALCGRLEMPLKVGIVGGAQEANPATGLFLRMMRVGSAQELAQVMAAVGLAQNFSALRALVTEGIQAGHMTLHARTVVKAAGTPPELFDQVLERLIGEGEVKVWRAREVLGELQRERELPALDEAAAAGLGVACGKLILLGEHAAVFGEPALACPVPIKVRAQISGSEQGVQLAIPAWGLEYRLTPGRRRRPWERSALRILEQLGLEGESMRISLFSDLPRGVGLGSSAAMAVAILRAMSKHFDLNLSVARINEIAWECEQFAHGAASGVDNAVSAHETTLLYRKGTPPSIEPVVAGADTYLVIGLSGTESLTAVTVENVRSARDRNPAVYDRIFKEIGELAVQARRCLERGRLEELGDLMNVNHGLLNGLQLATPELERLVDAARMGGALGAKLTGGGGGGAMVALCAESCEPVRESLEKAGAETIALKLAAGGGQVERLP